MNKIKRNALFVCLSMLSILFSTPMAYAQFVVETDTVESPTNNILSQEGLSKDGSLPKTLDTNKDLDNGYHFGIWVNYQQQFGAIGDKFLTVGGPSFGFNLGKYFFIGGGVYSSFSQQDFGGVNDHSFVYGGGIIGFRWNPKSPVVFRTQVLVGGIAFDTISRDVPGLIENRSTSLIVVPEIAFDIRLVGFLFLSLSANYRYVADLPDAWSEMKGLGALSGTVSLGLSF